MKKIRVAIDARMPGGQNGGVESVVVGMAQGLAELDPQDIDYRFAVFRSSKTWLTGQAGNAPLAEFDEPGRRDFVIRKIHGGFRRSAGLVGKRAPARLALHRDTNMVRLAPDVVHYTFQEAGLPGIPFIYQPHDLLHRHLPQFLSPEAVRFREVLYPTLCEQAAAIAVGTRWVKSDIVAQYGIAADKIFVIPLAPPAIVESDPSLASIGLPPGLPEQYLLYPAVNWPHKNHERLIHALALARSEGVDIELVLTGAFSDDFPDPRAMAAKAGVADHVHVLGYLTAPQLAAVYQQARGVVVPTLFESASFPIWEAFARGIPVACSTVTALPDQVAGNALLFDPLDSEAMAAAMASLWQDDELCERLAVGGRARVAPFTWRRTAAGFAALYRKVAGRALSAADEQLLAAEEL